MKSTTSLCQQAAVALFAGVVLHACAFETRDVDEMLESTIRIWVSVPGGKMTSGSGFVIDDHYVATNYHVIEAAVSDKARVSIGPSGIMNEDELFPASVVWTDANADAAILHVVRSIGRDAVLLAGADSLKVGDEVFAIGFPGVADHPSGGKIESSFEPTFTRGVLSKAHSVPGTLGRNRRAVYQHDATINKGNSGGPLTDACGRVIGLNTFGAFENVVGDTSHENRVFAAGIGWAVSVRELEAGFAVLRLPFEPNETRCDPEDRRAFLQNASLLASASIVAISLVLLGRRDSRRAISKAVTRTVEVFTHSEPESARAAPADGLGEALDAGPSEGLNDVPGTSPTSATLVCVQGALIGQTVPLAFEPTTLGRSPEHSDVVLPEGTAAVSKRHCALRFDRHRGVVWIEDLGSTFGTFLDSGERIAADHPVEIRDDFDFFLGSKEQVFSVRFYR